MVLLPAAVVVVLVVAAAQGARASGRLQGDAMQVGELVPVRLNVTGGGRVVVGFMMCDADAHACSKVELWGVAPKKMRALLYKNFVDCTGDGWGGVEVGSNIMANSSKVFPASTVFLVTRASEKLLTVRLLADRTGASSTSVPLADTMDHLYVKDHWRKDFSPDNATVEFLTDRGWRRECEHGGVLELRAHGEDTCHCAHGFDGPSCETACGPNRYGPGCSRRCAEDGPGLGRGCKGIHFHDTQDNNNKVCGTGFHGELCEQVCRPGTYGPGCTLSCGQCDLDPVGAGQGLGQGQNQGQCDPYTGQCPAGCRPGYHGPTCHRALTHLTVGPDIVNVTETTVRGTFVPSMENTAGSGPVAFFDVQYREVRAAAARGWVAGVLVRRLASSWSASPAPPHDFVLEGLRPGVQYDVRVVLLDGELRGYEAAPQVRVATGGTRRVSDVTVFNVTARAASVSWSSPADIAVLVQFECVRSLVCAEDCSQTSSMLAVDNRTTASVEGLLPGTTYRVLVSPRSAPGEQAESTTFTTAFTVPEAVPEAVTEGDYDMADKSATGLDVAVPDPGVFSVTSMSATIRWRMPASCLDLNGVPTGTRWQLFLRAVHCPQGCPPPLADRPLFGQTTSTELVLEPLQPGTAYELRLWLHNTEGYNPDRFLSVRFTTTSPGSSF